MYRDVTHVRARRYIKGTYHLIQEIIHNANRKVQGIYKDVKGPSPSQLIGIHTKSRIHTKSQESIRSHRNPSQVTGIHTKSQGSIIHTKSQESVPGLRTGIHPKSQESIPRHRNPSKVARILIPIQSTEPFSKFTVLYRKARPKGINCSMSLPVPHCDENPIYGFLSW
jgi:hypothetical protein